MGHINEVLSKLRIFDNCPERGEVGYMRFKGLIEIMQHYETSKRTYFAVKAFELLVDPEMESSFLTKILTDLQFCYTKRKSCEKYDKDFLKVIEILTRSCPEHFSTLSKINSMLAYVISKKDYWTYILKYKFLLDKHENILDSKDDLNFCQSHYLFNKWYTITLFYIWRAQEKFRLFKICIYSLFVK